MQQISILIIIVLSICYIFAQNHYISTLKLIQIVNRHGDNTPTKFYPNDPYQNETEWPEGIARLIPIGKKRMYEFGLKLREIYQKFYGELPKNIYVRSSGAIRCLETAEAILAGMYVPTGHWIWTTDQIGKYWQPIPIQSAPTNSDGLLVPDSECPTADRELESIYKSNADVLKIMAENKEFFAKITAKTNYTISTIKDGYVLADILQIELENGRELPEWMNDIDNNATLTLEKLHKFAIYSLKYDWSTPLIQRLRAGLILQELTNNMQNANKYSNEQLRMKVYHYSGHGTHLSVIMQALKVYDDIPPTYGSAVIFELHQNNTVKLFYTHVIPEFQISQLMLTKVCGRNECTLTEFSNYTKQFIPDNWNRECNSN